MDLILIIIKITVSLVVVVFCAKQYRLNKVRLKEYEQSTIEFNPTDERKQSSDIESDR